MKKEIIELITEEILDKQLQSRNVIREYGMPDPEFGFDLEINHFLKLMYVHFTSQSYGARVEKKLILEYDLIKVPSSFDKGDAKTKKEEFGELKISFKNTAGDFSFVQIRPHQNCDFYLLQGINPDENFKQYSFIIKKDRINEVLSFFKATNCHGVLKNKSDISQIELRFSVVFGSKGWEYLCSNFLCDDVKTALLNL